MNVIGAEKPSDARCPLCEADPVDCCYRDSQRAYLRCRNCRLVFVPAQYFLSPAHEHARYDLHNNDPLDTRYRAFLSRLGDPLIERLAPGAEGLDFGCGPGPTLSLILSEAGFPTQIFDPIYAPNTEVWNQTYDFVTASEVVEHLYRPRFEFERLWSLLRPRGILGIMTKRLEDPAAFANWHYKDDPTHVIFFAEQTFRWLSEHLSAELTIVGPDVVLLRKSIVTESIEDTNSRPSFWPKVSSAGI